MDETAGTRSFPSGVTVTPSWIPNALGIDGPVISASRIPTLAPVARMRHAIREVTKDFPTPPLPLTTPMTFFTELAGFNFSRKLCGSLVLLPQFAEHVPQLWVQFSAVSLITISLSNFYSPTRSVILGFREPWQPTAATLHIFLYRFNRSALATLTGRLHFLLNMRFLFL